MKLSKSAAAVGLLVAAVGSAHAASVTQNITFASGSTNYESAQSFNLFDSSLYGGATLDSVEISYTFGTTTGTFSVKNTGGIGSTVSGSGYSASSGVSLDVLIGEDSFNVDSLAGSSTSIPNFTLNRNQSTSPVSVDGVSLSDSATYTSFATLALFTGSGLGDLIASAFSSTTGTVSTTGSGSLTATYSADASGIATIVYNYTPVSSVPEPESYAMLLAGLAAIGVVARRRRVQG